MDDSTRCCLLGACEEGAECFIAYDDPAAACLVHVRRVLIVSLLTMTLRPTPFRGSQELTDPTHTFLMRTEPAHRTAFVFPQPDRLP